MQQSSSTVTVFFEDPYWVAVYERQCGGKLEVCKITFGGEPKDQQVYAYLLEQWPRLQFSPAVAAATRPAKTSNAKRRQREAARQVAGQGIGTKAQQALKLQQAEGKSARKQRSRLQREADQQRRYQLKQEKKKQKHKGH